MQSLVLFVTTQGRFCPTYSTLPGIVWSTTSKDPEAITALIVPFLYLASFLDTPLGEDKTIRSVFYDYYCYGSAACGTMSAPGVCGQSAALMLHFVSDERLMQMRDSGYPIVGVKEGQAIDVLHVYYFQKMLTCDHVTFKIYEGAGHAVFLQCMDEVANDILGVIRRNDGAK